MEDKIERMKKMIKKSFQIKVKGWREVAQANKEEKSESQLMLLLGLLELE